MKRTSKSAVGTSFHDSIVKATVAQLKNILGEPDFATNDGSDKVNFEWDMEEETGNVFTVYDYKYYRELDENEEILWHIGGNNKRITENGKREIEEALRSINA